MQNFQIQDASSLEDELGSFLLLQSTQIHTLMLEMDSQGGSRVIITKETVEAVKVKGNEAIRMVKYQPNPKN